MIERIPDFAVKVNDNMLLASIHDWNAHKDIIGEPNVVYAYITDETDDMGQPVPLFKVGDGNAYLIDMVFNKDLGMIGLGRTDGFNAHINASNMEQIIFG